MNPTQTATEKVQVQQLDQEDAPGERKRHRQQNVRRFFHRVVGAIEKDEDHQQDERNNQLQPLAGS